MPEEKDNQFELLSSFHKQFDENQNHHQTVFIQFISAVLVVLIGYGFVYSHVGPKSDLLFTNTDKDSSAIYSVAQLVGSFLISQTILGLLITLTANIGYGFRRDQLVVYKIRNFYLNRTAEPIFGNRSFDPRGKGISFYLPEFNRMFIFAIFIIQLILCISLCVSVSSFTKIGNVVAIVLYALCALPIIWSIRVYFLYYRKYNFVVNERGKTD